MEMDEQQYNESDFEPELPIVEIPVDQDIVSEVDQPGSVDGILGSYYSGYMSGYLDGRQDSDDLVGDLSSADVDEGMELVGIETFALGPVTSSTGLKGVLLDIIGPYDNIITQYRYQANSSSSYSYVHEMSPDYPWIGSCLLFIVMIFCLFQWVRRMLGWKR